MESLQQQANELLASTETTKGTPSYKLTLNDLWIRTKDKKIIRFGPNLKPIQREYLSILCPEFEKGDFAIKGIREIDLKARQEGVSTLIAALFFLDSVNTPHTYSAIIAHEADATKRMFGMITRFYEHLPPEKKPKTKYASKTEFYWPELDSSFFIGTAGGKEFGRSATINNAHLAEVAFWEDAETLVAGLMQAVPADGNIFIESTANGFGNYYQQEWDLAVEKQSVFKPRFWAWFQDPDYQTGVPAGFERTAWEQDLAEQHGLNDRQLQWYRDKRLELKGDLAQEYPSNPIEAFLVSGTPYFDNANLLELLRSCPKPIYRLNVDHRTLGANELLKSAIDAIELPQILPNTSEEAFSLDIWELPIAGHRYTIGADPAEGLTPKGDPDSCSAIVYDAETWSEVARLRGIWDTFEFGMMLAHLGSFYNTAFLGVERNTHGHGVLNTLMHVAKYPNPSETADGGGLYFHEDYDDQRAKKQTVKKPGWPTTTKTKTLALDFLAEGVQSGDVLLRSKDTIRQMVRFVHLPGGKCGGEAGSHDDNVIAASIGVALLRSRPRSNQNWDSW